jgi:hypothetical protein
MMEQFEEIRIEVLPPTDLVTKQELMGLQIPLAR